MQQRGTPQSVYILAFDDCDQLDVTGPFEILQQAAVMLTASDPKAVLDLRIKSVPGTTADPNGMVRAATGLRFASEPWTTDELPDLLIVAGGIFDNPDGSPAGIGLQKDNPAFTGRIAAQHEAGRTVTSVCTGAFGVVGAGITGGRHMTSHPDVLQMLADFAETKNAGDPVKLVNPNWEARVVDAGDIISCGGVTSGIDEALYLVNAFWSASLEDQVRSFVDYPYRGTMRTYPC